MRSINKNKALAIIALAVFAIAGSFTGCSCSSGDDFPQGTPDTGKVIVIAFDGMDPKLAGQWMDEGLLPNLASLRKKGTFSPLGTSIPPQSPVAWSNFITGKNPGGHGIFDFIHRDPQTYLPYLSTSKTVAPEKFWKVAGYKVPLDEGQVNLLRKGKAFFEYLGEAGVPTTVFAVPSNFPPVEGPFRTLSGMGTPDLLGGYGTFSYYTDDPPSPEEAENISGGRIYPVTVFKDTVKGKIVGPKNTFLDVPDNEEVPDAEVDFIVHIDPESNAAEIEVEGEKFLLNVGEWSDWVQINFAMAPVIANVKGMVRFLLKEVSPSFRLYVSPINIDPREPAMPISWPPEYSLELAEAHGGPFHTQGIPEDTKALSSGILTNEEFLEQAETVLDERLDLYRYELSRFQNGFLFFYFSSSDQVSHMFWRTMVDGHPAYHEAQDAAFRDVIKQVYIKLDKALGEVFKLVDDKTTLLVMSDHGFANYKKSFHLSSWLLDNKYIMLKDPTDRESEFLQNVEWMGSQAYSLGINGVYLNLMGREAMGVVSPMEADKLLDEISQKLLEVTDPETGDKVIDKVYKASKFYTGKYANTGPDLIIGYATGYRGSWETALGKFPEGSLLRPNTDAWSGDHCMASEEVPGVLFANHEVKLKNPKLYDLPVTILELFGLERPSDMIGKNLFTGK